MGIKPDPKLVAKYGPKVVTTPQLQAKERFFGALAGAVAGDAQAGGPSRHAELLSVVLRSLSARGKLELADVARGYVDWFRRAGAAGVAGDEQQKLALENLRAGEPPEQAGALAWEDLGRKPAFNGALAPCVPVALAHADALENLRAGEPPEQAGALAWEDLGRKPAFNGALAPCVPVALAHADALEGLAGEIASLVRLTHADPRCVAASQSLATAIALLVKGDAVEEVVSRASSAGALVHDGARQAVERGAGKKIEDLSVDDDPSSALKALEAGFCALIAAPSLEEGVKQIAARGGDARANAAVAGALLGARYGKNTLPAAWASQKAVTDMAAHAEALFKRVSGAA
jgi:ADP-ribosylglycohydrolase